MSAADVSTIFLNQTRERFRDDVLLRHLRKRRWFGAKSEALRNASFSLLAPWNSAQGTWTLAIVDVDPEEGGRQRYFQPLAIEWETREIDPLEKLGAWAIAKVRHRDRVGLLHDAFGDPEFSRALARSMGTPGDVPLGPGRLRFSNTPLYASLAAAIDDEVRVPALEQSNTGVFFGNRLFLKAYRHLRLGINPEVEVGRFLTEASPFPHIAPIAGVVEYVEEGAEPVALGLLQKFVENQGDLWTQTLEHLRRILAVPGAASVAEQRGPEASTRGARNRACCATSPASCARSPTPPTPPSCGASRARDPPTSALSSCSEAGSATRCAISSPATARPPRASPRCRPATAPSPRSSSSSCSRRRSTNCATRSATAPTGFPSP